MKKYSHVYVALESIKWLYDGLANLRTFSGKKDRDATKRYRAEASKLQHLLDVHQHFAIRAAWDPDAVLRDMFPAHICKLYSAADFPGVDISEWEERDRDRLICQKPDAYYRQAGSLPYRIDHLCHFIHDSITLKADNDCFSMQQVLYQMLLLSHYVADAHVPLHCDARDMSYNAKMPGAERFYYKTFIHKGKHKETHCHSIVEDAWESACLRVGLEQEMFKPLRGEYERKADKSTLHEEVTFDLTSTKARKLIKPVLLRQQDLLAYLVRVCFKSKKRSHRFIDPADQVDGPLTPDELEPMLESALADHTREIFADSISAVISLWMFCWLYPESFKDARGDA